MGTSNRSNVVIDGLGKAAGSTGSLTGSVFDAGEFTCCTPGFIAAFTRCLSKIAVFGNQIFQVIPMPFGSHLGNPIPNILDFSIEGIKGISCCCERFFSTFGNSPPGGITGQGKKPARNLVDPYQQFANASCNSIDEGFNFSNQPYQ